MRLDSKHVTLSVGDGTEMRAYVSQPSTGEPHSGIIVFQEALGVNSQIRGVADRYAKLGFVAIAPDLFHRVRPGYEASVLNMDELMPLIRAMTVEGFAADAAAAHGFLTTEGGVSAGKTVAMGFCIAFLSNALGVQLTEA